MRLLRKKLEVEIAETLRRAIDTTQRAVDNLSKALENHRDAMKLVEEKDAQIKRLQAELTIQQAIREFPTLSTYVH
jgi:DNA-binding transcriptional regulator GbsR (MarR family)